MNEQGAAALEAKQTHDQACGTCRFARWVFTDNDTGRCKRFPPGLILGVGMGDTTARMDVRNVYVQQPLIARTDWCGEYQHGLTMQHDPKAEPPHER